MHLLTLRRFAVVLAIGGLILLVGVSQQAGAKSDASPTQSLSATQAQPPGSQYVGSDSCKGCHEDVVNRFAANPHWDSTFKVDGTEVHSCETCHGPGAAHVQAGGDKSKIFVFKERSPAEISERCLTCHQATQEHGNFMRSQHQKNGVSCIGCHSAHYAREKNALLIQDQPNLCYTCHVDTKADFAKPFRHRVNEKLITCDDCHNVHGGYQPFRRSLRTTANQEQVCFKCHRDKEGPFLFEHLPVKTEGCWSCHAPHGSTNPRLLRVWPVNTLCMQCHTLTTNSGTEPIPSFHNQAQKYQACTLCHPAIHGTNGAETLEY
ncbi:MAG TPA: DmsE family decaheme c-type cytochrome [Terriglobales bacterium]|nr:DmsE family decaheme c-type cytochrome [Terriglobales bacterium]